MKKSEYPDIPFLPISRDFYPYCHELNNFDPLGSYTGRVQENDIPVQDADDL